MMRKIFLTVLVGISSLSIHASGVLKEWEDNQVTGINREDGRATFWYYPTREAALTGGYYHCPSNISLNGKWKFSFATCPDERKADFYQPAFDVSGWDEIQVPGSWPLQGYDKAIYLNHPYEFAVKNPYPPRVRHDWNPVGSFRRTFTVPHEWKDKRVVLHFGAVKSAFYVWVNGRKVGYSQDSKMQAEFDITSCLQPGENVLAVEVYRFSIGSYLECQDFWRLAGIKRDVWLYATSKTYVKDFRVNASLENGYKDGRLDVEVEMATVTASSAQQLNVQLVDEKGSVITGDHILYIYGCYMKERGKLLTNTVVTTVMSNFGLYKAFDEQGIGYAKTAVGDKYVYEYMAKNGCRIGGEQSGHIIFSKYASTGDGILTSLKMMEVMLAKKKPMSELAAPLKIYPQVLENVRVTDKKAAQNDPAVQEAVSKVAEALGDTGRILVRESGTEPVVRVMVEAPDHDTCQKYVDEVVNVICEKGYKV